jgi:hypothetical protein
MNLAQIQRAVFEVIRQPLTPSQHLRPRMPDGRRTREIAKAIIKPNDRLASHERLEIYNQQYWFRILSSFAEDFPGLRGLIGVRKFDQLSVAYLSENPSQTFTLRNLGKNLESWLRRHPEFAPGNHRMAIDMVRVEWAEIEAFDGPESPRFSREELAGLGGHTVFRLQPHLQMLELAYPVDDLLFRVRRAEHSMVSNAVRKSLRRPKIRKTSLPRAQTTYLVVYRLQDTVYFKRLTREAFALMGALGKGKPLGEALETTMPKSPAKIEAFRKQVRAWFENWASLGWLAR